jgi:threonine aldolase
MAGAEVGDDVYAEDPTVNRLQRTAAELFGKEAALFVPSGTMGNQIAIACHTRPGQEVICEAESHIVDYEMAAMAALSGVIPRPVAGGEGGRLTWERVRRAVRPRATYHAATGLVAVENTHNMAGGTVLEVEAFEEIAAGARRLGLPVHLDGARIFNAAVYSGRPVAELARGADTVMFCLSKGLCAPVGSLLLGSRELIEQAWLVRKRFGGGMRQVGVVAAAGLVALETMVDRLAGDHANARTIALGAAALPGVIVDPELVQTNIVIIEVDRPAMQVSAGLRERGVLANPIGERRLRMVTHHDVSPRDCLDAVEALREVMAA